MAHKAPGKSFRKGITLPQLFKMFPDDATATAWIERIRWPDGPVCPKCESGNVQHPVKHATMTHRCRSCRSWFSVRTGTMMESSRLGLQIWVIAVYLLNTGLKGQSSMKLHRDLGITQKSAWYLAHRIREAWEDKGGSLFSGPVEVDETYVGGKRKNMPNKKRRGLTGRGSVGKTAVVGMKDRNTKRVIAQPVPTTDAKTLQDFVTDRTVKDATVYTDEAAAYKGIDREHEAVKHSVSEYVNGMAHTNGMESFWSMLKRGYQGTYHHMNPQHLQRYVNEFSGRHNIRYSDTIDQMSATFTGMVGKRLPYEKLTVGNGLPSEAQ